MLVSLKFVKLLHQGSYSKPYKSVHRLCGHKKQKGPTKFNINSEDIPHHTGYINVGILANQID